MAARLTDKQKKKIIADYVQLGSYNATAKANGVSLNTVKNEVMQTNLDGRKRQRGCPSKSKACAYVWGNGRDCGAGKVCYVRPRGGG